MRWAGHVARMKDRRGAYRDFVKETWGRLLGRPRRRWDNTINVDLQKVAFRGHGLAWSGSGYGQVAGSCECRNEPSVFI